MDRFIKFLSYVAMVVIIAPSLFFFLVLLTEIDADDLLAGVFLSLKILLGFLFLLATWLWFSELWSRAEKNPRLLRIAKWLREFGTMVLTLAFAAALVIAFIASLFDGKSCADFDIRGCIEWVPDR